MAVKFGLAIGARDRAALGVRAQELLLSRPAEGLPDQPVRAADRRRRRTSTSCSRTAARKPHRRHARAPRGGRRQVAARGAARARPASTSTAPARRCSRSSPSRTCARRKEAVAYMKKVHTLVRYLGICDGNMQEGSFRCDANVSVRPLGAAEVRHARRDQEHQLLPLRREGDQLRGRAPDRAARGRRQGGAGDAPLRSGQGETRSDALEGRGERLPLLPRPGPAAGRARRGLHRARWRAQLPELPDEKAQRFVTAIRAVRPTTPGADREPRAGRLLRDRGARVRRRSQARGQLGRRRAGGAPQSRRPRDHGQPRRRRRRWRGCCGASTTAPSPARSPRKCSRPCGPRARTPTRSSRRAGLRQITDDGAIEQAIDAVLAAQPGPAGRLPLRQGQAVRLLRRPGDEGDAGQGQSRAR